MMNVVIQRHLYQRAPKIFSDHTGHLVFHAVETENDRSLLEKNILEAVKKYHCKAVVIDSKKFSNNFFSALPSPFMIARFGTGTDNIPINLCQKLKLTVSTTKNSATISTAEHAIACMLSLAKKLTSCDAEIKSGRWQRPQALELQGKTLGLIGLGMVGQQVARMASNGFQMRTLAWVRPQKKRQAKKIVDECLDNLLEVAMQADVVSLHLSLNDETENIISRDFLEKMKPESYLINTARAKLVDNQALFEVLSEKKIAGAALDVFEKEPYDQRDDQRDDQREKFHTLNNILLTPHIASNSKEANERTAKEVIKNLVAFEKSAKKIRREN